MPMDFPDLRSLKLSFDDPKAVPYKEGEPESEYRERCAVWVETKHGDKIEAMEIRSGKGWDRWNPTMETECLKKAVGPGNAFKSLMNLQDLGKPKDPKA